MNKNPSLFQGFGIEAEYMIVDSKTLDIAPDSEYLLQDDNGEIVNEVEKGECCWSNELALHVIEIKTNGPVGDVQSIDKIFPTNISKIQDRLNERELTLLPTAMHPWMNPDKEFKIWKLGNQEIYNSYDRIFNCKGHGWSNLQSVHLNLGFQGNEEFYQLHSAIRLILPLIPMVSASSPFVEGIKGEFFDNRISFYRNNQSKIPSITGNIIPEPVRNEQDYQDSILSPMYRDIAPLDPGKILQEEWLNSRGAIARFDRSAIEIRVMDIQESPRADREILSRIVGLLKNLVKTNSPEEMNSISQEYLYELLWEGIRTGTKTLVKNKEYLRLFKIQEQFITGIELFCSVDNGLNLDPSYARLLTEKGNLSERILAYCGNQPSREKLRDCYKELNTCLLKNKIYA